MAPKGIDHNCIQASYHLLGLHMNETLEVLWTHEDSSIFGHKRAEVMLDIFGWGWLFGCKEYI